MTADAWLNEAVATVAVAAVKAQGCRCDVDLVVKAEELEPGHVRIQAQHDDWCPLLRATLRRSN